ncbi:N-6 DNA methylase [Halovenus halobia]|uniref:N-6 DNA methylase n=1 Tax=Halovenus halobia TaxID=3396622 RepID=UPI003F5589C6
MTPALDVSALDRTSDRYERFVEQAREQLDTDDQLRAARDRWRRYLTESHGDLSGDGSEHFLDSLYVEYVVAGLIDSVEQAYDVTVTNRDPQTNSGRKPVAPPACRQQIADDAGIALPNLSAETLQSLDVGALRTLYERIITREMRLALGEYYTPRGLAELAVESLSADESEASYLDPGCGSGVFLWVCLERKRRALADRSPAAVVEHATESVLGIDTNPVAVLTSKLSYLLALGDCLQAVDQIELPVFCTDALGLSRDRPLSYRGQPFQPTVDNLVGNPPWLTWDRLDEELKHSLRERDVERLGLLPHDGASSRLGHSNDDLSVPFVWVCLDRYLDTNGAASVVLKRDLLTGPAGAVLRRLSAGDRSLAVEQIHDFAGLAPFGGQVGADAAVYTLRADSDSSFPVETTIWTEDGNPAFDSLSAMTDTLARTTTSVAPLDPEDQAAAWVRTDGDHGAVGQCAHEIRHGVKDDAEAVFGLDRDQLDHLEPDRVFPYLKSRHIVKYGLFGHDLRLVPVEKADEDNEAHLREHTPATYEYLDNHREQLADRASSWLDSGRFYNIFGVGEYTWAPYKVVWCRLGFKPHFAVVSTVSDPVLGEKLVVPGDHCMFISLDNERDAHALCALLNSAVYQRSLREIAGDGKSSLSKAVVSELELPLIDDIPDADRLAALSKRAHEVVPNYTDRSKRAYNKLSIEELAPIQAEIDRLAEAMVAER